MVGRSEMRNKRTVRKKKERKKRDFHGGPVVKNPAADVKLPHATGQRSPSSTTPEPVCPRARALRPERLLQ